MTETQNEETQQAPFDPERWMKSYFDTEETTAEKEEEEEEVEETEEVVAKEEPKEEIKHNTKEEVQQELENTDWKKVADDLGIEANNYEEFIKLIKDKKEPVYLDEDETIKGINTLLKLEDKDILSAYKVYVEGYDKEDAQEFIDAYEKNDMLSLEAKKARKFFEKQKVSHIGNIKKSQEDNVAKRKQSQADFTKTVKNVLSESDKLFDVVSFKDDQKKEVEEYIMSGNFQKEVLQEPKKLIEFAFFNLYNDTVKNVLTQQGESKGIKAVIDNKKPIKNNSAYVVSDKQDKVFDPNKFMAGMY